MYKVRVGSVFRTTDSDQHWTRQLGRVLSSGDDGKRKFAYRIWHQRYFANTILHVKTKITQNDGTNFPANVANGPANLFLHSLFSQVDISLNGTLITASANTYPYRAMLETLLSYGQDAKTSQLTSALYYKDTAGHIDSVTFDANVNEGLAARRRLAARSAVMDTIGRLHADIFF